MTLQAFHNDPKLKQKYLERVRQHRELDQIVKGQYWENGKGCAVGCTIHSSNHSAYETELGIPEVLAHLEDRLFESMHNSQALIWPEHFLNVIKPGADLSEVWPKFAVWLLVDPRDGVIQYAGTNECRKAIQDVARLYSSGNWRKGDEAQVAAARTAEAAAAAAGASRAERAAKTARAASAAAWAAAWASAAAARVSRAARAATAAAAAWAAEEAIKKQSEKLLQLLIEAE